MNGTIDLSRIDGFDVSRVSNVKGAVLKDGCFTEIAGVVSYDYDCGTDHVVTFAMTCAEEGMSGDVNGDGTVDISDAVTLQKWLLNDSSADSMIWQNADLDNDSVIDVYDLVLLKKMLVR